MKAAFLSRFTPSSMKPEALEAMFVQREELAERLVETITDSALTPSKHHVLLVGPRGIGKTHLVALTYHRIRAVEEIRDGLLIAWLREEEWGVTSFLDLLMRIFRALLEEYNDEELAERVESLYGLPPDVVEQAAGKLLKEFVGDRTLLILMENLEDMFGGLGDIGQKRMRAYLQENPFCTILATAQSLFNGVSLQNSPFYGFFRVHHLEKLDFDGAILLLTKIADLENDKDLASFIATPQGRARIRAVRHLAGDSHRVYVIFSQFLTRESLDELVESVMRMLDDLTPYYQSRMMFLSPQQRKIVEFLINRRSAVPVKEIAKRCFMTHQTASGQLKALRDMGYVSSIAIGRESYYELREPLMRLCAEVKKQRGDPIRLLVDFLRIWYSRTELEQRLSLLSSEATVEREYVLHALRTAEGETEDPLTVACLADCLTYLGNDPTKALGAAEELVEIRGEAFDWLLKANCLIRLDRLDESLNSLDKTIELQPDTGGFWANRASVLAELGCHEEAQKSINRAIDLVEHRPTGVEWAYIGAVLGQLGRYSEALETSDKAFEVGGQTLSAFFYRANILLALNRWDEGLVTLDDALERFAHGDETDVDDRGKIVRNLFIRTPDHADWRERIAALVELYNKYQSLASLGTGLVESIPALNSSMVSDAAARMWLDVWKEVAGDHDEFQIPLRLLDAAVRYRETHDQRVLLGLPIEERKLLEPLLEGFDN